MPSAIAGRIRHQRIEPCAGAFRKIFLRSPLQLAGLRNSRGYPGKLVSYEPANMPAETFTGDKTDYETTSKIGDISPRCTVRPRVRLISKSERRVGYDHHPDREVGNIRFEICFSPNHRNIRENVISSQRISGVTEFYLFHWPIRIFRYFHF